MPTLALAELSPARWEELMASWGEPTYRAQQVLRWVYRAMAPSFPAMTDLPAYLRLRLGSELAFSTLTPVAQLTSARGDTEKVAFRLTDGLVIEAVGMSYRRGKTVCLSVQVGCGMGCPFCA